MVLSALCCQVVYLCVWYVVEANFEFHYTEYSPSSCFSAESALPIASVANVAIGTGCVLSNPLPYSVDE